MKTILKEALYGILFVQRMYTQTDPQWKELGMIADLIEVFIKEHSKGEK